MAKDEELKIRWEALVARLSDRFSEGEPMDIDAMVYLVGLQELGQLHRKFRKDDKLDLMHVGVCTLLEPFGYYAFERFDEEGWPHFELLEPLPVLKAGEQSVLMKQALVRYFVEKNIIE